MRLSELITPDRVLLPLEAATASEAATRLIDRLVATGAVQEPDKLRRRVEEGRGEDIVAMGDRALVMHYRTDAVRDLVVALGVSPAPVRRELGDGEAPSARIVLLILAPPRLATRYLQVLGAFARAFGDASVVEALLAAPSAEAVVSLNVLQAYEVPEQLTVRDVMTERPRTTSPDTPLRDAASQIARAGITTLPVVETDGLLVGILSEKELIRHLLASYLPGASSGRGGAPASTRRAVRDVMTRQVLCVSPEQPLAEAASIMTNKDVDGVPVVREGRVVGFLTRGDIIRKLIGY